MKDSRKSFWAASAAFHLAGVHTAMALQLENLEQMEEQRKRNPDSTAMLKAIEIQQGEVRTLEDELAKAQLAYQDAAARATRNAGAPAQDKGENDNANNESR